MVAAAGVASGSAELQVANSDVSTSVRSPTQGNTVTLEVAVHNTGDTNATGFTVTFYLDSTGSPIGSVSGVTVAAGTSQNFTASWSVGSTTAGAHSLIAWADSANSVVEADDGNNQGTHAFTVNVAPSASATVNTTSLTTFNNFAFDATGSTDTDGTIESYLWIFDDGNTVTGATADHAYTDGALSPGKSYRVTVVVTDDDGGSDTAQVTVNVINRPPVAAASSVTGLTVTYLVFDGGVSTDSDGRIVNATWAFTDSVTLYGITVLRTFDDDGSYGATLTVKDDDGATSAKVITITISNQAAVPVVTTTPVMPFVANVSALFDGRLSYDVDGGITNYTWLFPGGVTAFGVNATHMFTQNGTYNVTLVLVDDDGWVSQLTIVALVGVTSGGPGLPSPPVGRITASATSVLTGVPVTLDAYNSTDDTGIVSYIWDFGDASSGIGILTTHTWAQDGNFAVSLNVTDTDGNSATTTITVRVLNRVPAAAVGFAPPSALTLSDILFDGSGSSDPDGTILFYRWDFGDGSALYGSAVSHQYARPAVYSVTLTVTDNDGGEGRATVLVTINNRAPTAVVPANVTLPTYEEHLFDAFGSFDPDGVIQLYTWDFGDGSPAATGRTVKHLFTSHITFTVTLTVRDDFGATNARTMSVTATNRAPTVYITAPFTAYTSQSVTFVGTAGDLDGTGITAWSWNFGDSSPLVTTGGTVAHSYPAKGTYTVTVTVTDDSLLTGSATFDIRVLNQLPTAVISAPSAGLQVPSLTAVSFASTGSVDPESGGALTFFWIFGDGAVASGAAVSHAFGRAGTFTVILTVSDPDGGASSSTVGVVILNQAPTAVPAVNVTEAVPTLTAITFTAAGSRDVDGTIVAWLWDFGDGAGSSLKVAEHTYETASASGGAYTVRLTVTDNGGLKHNATIDVPVTNRAPVARAAHGSPVYAEIPSVFRGTDSSDPDGIVIGWVWEFGDGTAAQSGAEVSHTFATAGPFVVKLTVTDSRGGTNVFSENLTVAPKPIIDNGKPTQGTGQGPVSPGFDGVGVFAAIGAVTALALAARRRRA